MKISIIGGGNVATHLCVALSDKADEVVMVNSRTLEDLPEDSDIYIISVSDRAIAEVASRLPELPGIVAHTSGSVPMDVLSPYAKRYGVFYPLQTFTKWVDLDYSRIPVFIEGSDKSVATALTSLASLFTTHIHAADSILRKKLHVASVFACNYVNRLWTIADELLAADGLSLEVMRPLIDATVEKIHRLPPAEAQTGPASRGDRPVVEEHLKMLEGTPYQEIYRLLADDIMNRR